jgi:hypothetical protein
MNKKKLGGIGWVAKLVALLRVTASSLGSNPDIPKKSEMDDLRKGVAKKTYKKIIIVEQCSAW